MKIININWKLRDDGVIHFDPIGFWNTYYIYPENYDEDDNQKIKLNIINNEGHVLLAMEFTSVENAKIFAIEHFKNIIKQYID